LSEDLEVPYFKRDFLFRPGRWRGNIQLPVWSRLGAFSDKGIFIGHADQATTQRDLDILRKIGVKKVRGTNLQNSQMSKSVPLGLTNDTKESDLHIIFGNTNHFEVAHTESKNLQNSNFSIYANFSSRNNLIVRSHLLKMATNLPFVQYAETRFTERGRIDYLKDLRFHNLVLCPEGNGVDTHRLWETLYMGGIPVITKSQFLPTVVSQLPVLQLESWNQIQNLNYLMEEYTKIKTCEYNFDVLRMSWWRKQFSA
jgi:hypothetical protein